MLVIRLPYYAFDRTFSELELSGGRQDASEHRPLVACGKLHSNESSSDTPHRVPVGERPGIGELRREERKHTELVERSGAGRRQEPIVELCKRP